MILDWLFKKKPRAEVVPIKTEVVPDVPDQDGLTKKHRAMLQEGLCPDCGGDRWFEGPSGGMCTNYECAGCGSRFNLALPVYAARLGRRVE